MDLSDDNAFEAAELPEVEQDDSRFSSVGPIVLEDVMETSSVPISFIEEDLTPVQGEVRVRLLFHGSVVISLHFPWLLRWGKIETCKASNGSCRPLLSTAAVATVRLELTGSGWP
jgi:hypothetical protein